jgi:hypothetical protein
MVTLTYVDQVQQIWSVGPWTTIRSFVSCRWAAKPLSSPRLTSLTDNRPEQRILMTVVDLSDPSLPGIGLCLNTSEGEQAAVAATTQAYLRG